MSEDREVSGLLAQYTSKSVKITTESNPESLIASFRTNHLKYISLKNFGLPNDRYSTEESSLLSKFSSSREM
jgi:hypothetical protein